MQLRYLTFKSLSLFVAIIFYPAFAYSATIRDNPVTNTLAASDDGYSASVPLGFSTNFLGYSNSSLYVMNNGNVQFNLPPPPSNFEPTALTAINNRQTIAPFMGDVDTRLGTVVNYGAATIDNHSAFIVNWPGVGYYTAGITGFDKLNTFQLVIVDRSDIASGDFDIEFNYGSIQWDIDSGSAVSAGLSNGLNPGTHYLINGSSITGAFLDTNLTTGLIYVSNIGIPGRFLFLARNGLIITSPSVLTSIAVTDYQSAVAGQLDKWQGTIAGNFGSAITQINGLSTNDEKRNALERVGVSFLSAFADSAFKLASYALDQVELYLERKRDNPDAGNISAKNINSFPITEQINYFASASSDSGKFKRTGNQKGYRYNGSDMTYGLGFQFTDNLVLGAAFDYGNTDSKIEDRRGELNSKSYTEAIFLSDKFFGQGYLDFIAGYSNLFYDYQRDINIESINLGPDGKSRGKEAGFRLLGGYDFEHKKLTWGPVFGLQYLDLSIDEYTEGGAGNLSAAVSRQHARSLISSAGAKITLKVDTNWCAFFLNSHLSYEHEFKDNSRDVNTSFSGTSNTSYQTRIDGPERNYARLGIGLAGSIKNWLLLGIDYDTMFANTLSSEQRITASCRIKF